MPDDIFVPFDPADPADSADPALDASRTTGANDDLSDFTDEIANQIESFVVAVREIGLAAEPDASISQLLLQVSQLVLAGGRLGAIKDVVPKERFEPDAGYDPDVEGLRTSLRNLLEPIDDFTVVFDPYATPPEVVKLRLSDEIADMVTHLSHGLAHYKAGRLNEALWWWQFSSLSNWGTSATAVSGALMSVIAHLRLDAPADVTLVEDAILADTAGQVFGTQ